MWASHPTTRCRKAKFCKSVVREHSVGVDAYIDPRGARPFLRYVATNLPLPHGRTEASAPTKQNKNHAKRDVEDAVPYRVQRA